MKELEIINKDGKTFRICRKCEKELEFSFFDKCSKTKCGVRSICKNCRKLLNNEISKITQLKRKEYYELNKERLLKNAENYRIRNKEKILSSAKKYREENKEKVAISKRNSTKKRYENDGFFRVTTQLRKYVRRYFDIKTNPRNTMDIVGCSPQELKTKIESQFEDWMCWDNYGYGKGKWVIDHKIPLSSAIDIEELYKLCHYSNLQPLCWEQNMRKSNKIIEICKN
jgi:hypothetical protein